MSARTRCRWIKFRECSELLYGKKNPLKLKEVVHKSDIRPAILHENET